MPMLDAHPPADAIPLRLPIDDEWNRSAPQAALLRRIGQRTCSIAASARDRIEQRKQQEASDETADMRLPGNAGAIGADRNRSDAEDDVDAEPDCEKSQYTRVAQGACTGFSHRLVRRQHHLR